ncbi:hypothetical protein RM53_11215 [Brevundimonas nasdae]|uniref:Uncharacterized protein n=1 Tax=Brevundimonas nasdae TaxID=172043 RepID=A0A0B4CQF5_9CAUL|nr:hypothetical protein [Brevundimonas nasdae]KIC56626.1 hypothetical protein RM53_11215 [Brevundimonas nasdae]
MKFDKGAAPKTAWTPASANRAQSCVDACPRFGLVAFLALRFRDPSCLQRSGLKCGCAFRRNAKLGADLICILTATSSHRLPQRLDGLISLSLDVRCFEQLTLSLRQFEFSQLGPRLVVPGLPRQSFASRR